MPDPADRRPRLGAIYQQMRARFRDAELDTPDLDARLLVCHALAIEPVSLLSDPQRLIDPGQEMRIEAVARRRLAREPVARIIGEREFWGLAFRLSPHTLEPRADTETLVEAVLRDLCEHPARPLRVLDLGTGTGAILTAILYERPAATGIGIDISPGALQTARGNAERHGLADRARFVCMDYFNALGGRFDVIVSNPPYIPTREISGLAPEVAAFDPQLALDGGDDGLDAYRMIFESAPVHLRAGGLVAVEIGMAQGAAVLDIARNSGFSTSEPVRDLGNRDRVVLARAGGAR